MLLQPHSSHPFCSTHTTLTPTLGDGTVRVWDTETLECLYIIHPCSDVGDIFVVVYSAERETMYIGCQNTSIQVGREGGVLEEAGVDLNGGERRSYRYTCTYANMWWDWHNLSKPPTTPTTARFPPISPRYASSASSHFFDGYPADVSRAGTEDDDEEPARETRFVADGDVYMSAHDGYVYALLLGRDLPNDNGDILISGSGDGDVKLWTITDDASIRLLRTLPGNPDKGILTLALLDDEYLFCGMQGGDIKIWDLETDDVLALTIKNHQIFSGSADGTIRVRGVTVVDPVVNGVVKDGFKSYDTVLFFNLVPVLRPSLALEPQLRVHRGVAGARGHCSQHDHLAALPHDRRQR
ncbi:WD40-repeat-containing domain protein [Jimgerdemannia flammicorona]|uniref:WD40-repeat-containing domain protein n=1 Tax=Jimgerdemannia flammicorona TaxID=994334 RepID=A0A433Q6E9_9FUNG|nr:WD40-repeat-containing domain protein [Jimgerdemannia flammicorona]